MLIFCQIWNYIVNLCAIFRQYQFIPCVITQTTKGWVGQVCKIKANCPLVGPGPASGVCTVGGLSKGSQPVFTRVSERTMENSERLGRQARPGFEPGTSRLSLLSVTTPPLVGQKKIGREMKNLIYPFLKQSMFIISVT